MSRSASQRWHKRYWPNFPTAAVTGHRSREIMLSLPLGFLLLLLPLPLKQLSQSLLLPLLLTLVLAYHQKLSSALTECSIRLVCHRFRRSLCLALWLFCLLQQHRLQQWQQTANNRSELTPRLRATLTLWSTRCWLVCAKLNEHLLRNLQPLSKNNQQKNAFVTGRRPKCCLLA